MNAAKRDNAGKGAARTLRGQGQVPAIIYGHKRQPQSLAINSRDLDKLLSTISAESTVIELNLDGTMARTLIREIQRHPFKRQILHVDFQELVAGEKVVVSIPVVLMGVPEGVRLGGGILDQTMRELEIKCDPADIPNHIEADVTGLQIGSSLHARDLKIPEGVEVMDDLDNTVCIVAAPRAAIEAAAVVEGAETSAEPEVIGKVKEEGEDDAEGGDKKGEKK
ncbi:MAG: 50S ribosomal protein L25/general stress protein Ctc [Gemmatimonadaceae bacterium]|nr:50S ribosomal protein L25/general stress protein Ctc [Gemmatimonadaceae bacterium]